MFQCLYNGLPNFLGRLLDAYLHPLLGADELSGSHGSLSLPFVMKVMVCHFVSDSHEVMTALIVVLSLIVVVEILCNFIKLLVGGGRGEVSLCNQLSIVCISEIVPFYMALY
jgi:hypothetical protein